MSAKIIKLNRPREPTQSELDTKLVYIFLKQLQKQDEPLMYGVFKAAIERWLSKVETDLRIEKNE